jgi:multicomponent Na+:H+ antiporter subunit D
VIGDPHLPLYTVLVGLITAVLIFAIGEQRQQLRIVLNLAGAILKLLLVGVMLWGVYLDYRYEFRLPLLPGLDLVLKADALTMLFSTLSAILWLVTTIYAIGYLEDSPNRARFFGFFSLCVAATMGVATAGNLFTFFIFYELLTLATYPLVVHRGTRKALRAGLVYLKYTLSGSALMLIGMIWLFTLTGSQDFISGGDVRPHAEGNEFRLGAIFVLLVLGFGVKAALVPLHGWLPIAMVAPAPVSALLHAVAVVKAGAFGIVRVVYDVFGVDYARQSGLLDALAVLAAITILYGSVRALAQTDIKRRLAFSTVSQVSYIILGVAVGSPLATIGGLVHLVHQGLMKITLFFCAGNYAETLGIHRVDQLNGVGQRMPWSSAAFTVGALGMIGVPPVAGFISKWYLGLGGLEAGKPWVVGVLVASTLLNAAYFLPLLQRIWFQPPPERWPAARDFGRHETRLGLLLPTLFTALAALGAGVLAGMPFSPLYWVTVIVGREYG